ncbi:MAG: alpha/beta hydrolase [Crocinitomicaceae bacterium]|nr:alpha/beta hydrolase [Flavobacteriales bacterium]NQZ35230.1 alpha/beta hydrolase [Crocinitomicaceae bacterium]
MKKTEQYIILKDNRKLGFAEYGNTEGFPIIYCHGSQSSRLEMHFDMSFAIENDLRIITIDRPGHGISDFNPEGSILSFAKDVNQLTEYLELNKFSVAGMSAGSPFALGISYLFPENVYKTSIISGFAPFNKESKKCLSKDVKMMLNLAKTFPFLLKMLLKVQVKQLNKNPKKALKGFLKIMGQPDQEILKNHSVMEVIENMFTEAFRNGSKGVAYEISNLLVREWDFKLDEIRVPVTFWQGEKDNNVPFEWAELMNNEINNSKLKKYPEEGHLIIFQHAEEIFTDLKKTVSNNV